MCFNQIDNKVNISTPASKDMNTVMDVYIINNIISTKMLCYTRGQHIMCHDIMIILCCMMTTNQEVQLLAQCYCIHITCM